MTETAVQLLDEPDAFIAALRRVRAEFMEMPSLTLTLAQAARLWALDTTVCSAVLAALVDARFLVRTRHQAFARADESNLRIDVVTN